MENGLEWNREDAVVLGLERVLWSDICMTQESIGSGVLQLLHFNKPPVHYPIRTRTFRIDQVGWMTHALSSQQEYLISGV